MQKFRFHSEGKQGPLMTGSLFLRNCNAGETLKFLFPKGCIKHPRGGHPFSPGWNLNTLSSCLREEASSPLLNRASFLGMEGALGVEGAHSPWPALLNMLKETPQGCVKGLAARPSPGSRTISYSE